MSGATLMDFFFVPLESTLNGKFSVTKKKKKGDEHLDPRLSLGAWYSV